MSNPTASAAGGAMPAEAHKTRRTILHLFGAAPALAILPAIAAPSTTAELSALIEAHRAAHAAFCGTIDPLEAAEPDPETRVSCLGQEPCAIGHSDREALIEGMEISFQFQQNKLSTLKWLSPEIGDAALRQLETGRAAYLARLDEVFADHMVAREAYDDASNAEGDALLAICALRCASTAEIAIKVRYLAGLDDMLERDQREAFFASFLPEGEEIEAFV